MDAFQHLDRLYDACLDDLRQLHDAVRLGGQDQALDALERCGALLQIVRQAELEAVRLPPPIPPDWAAGVQAKLAVLQEEAGRLRDAVGTLRDRLEGLMQSARNTRRYLSDQTGTPKGTQLDSKV